MMKTTLTLNSAQGLTNTEEATEKSAAVKCSLNELVPSNLSLKLQQLLISVITSFKGQSLVGQQMQQSNKQCS